jgi:Ca2+-binding RTX toxin-like protein
MVRWTLVIACAFAFFTIAAGGAADELDALGGNMWDLCVDEECSAIWVEPVEPGVTLEASGDAYEEACEDDLGFADDAAGGGAVLTSDWGDCYYDDTPDGEAVVCEPDFPSMAGEYYYIAVGMQGSPASRVAMCYYNSSTSEWELAGWSDFGAAYVLIVDGQDVAESIQIVRLAQPDENCPLVAFTQRFDWTVSSSRELQIRGDGGIDYIYGSQYGDSALIGERVYGREGADKIWLDNDGVTYPYGYGGPGADEIQGSSSIDYVWGDDEGSGIGTGDEINRGANADRLSGVYGVDLVVGGTGRDYLWGGAEYDVLWPDNIEESLAYIDTCYGGDDEASCDDCEIHTDCDI